MRRAFTLIEILISASILGLGVLGIATLFAGAARQQQIASEQTDAERVARNIDSLLESRFDRFAGIAFEDDVSLGGPYFATGQWYPIASVPFGGVAAGRERGALSLDLTDGEGSAQSAYGLRERGDVVLYQLSGDLLTENWESGLSPSDSIWANATTAPGAPGATFRPNSLRDVEDAGWATFIEEIPGGRLHPGLVIEVDVYRERKDISGITLGLEEFTTRRFEFLDPLDVTQQQADAEIWPVSPEEGLGARELVLIDAAEASSSPPAAGVSRVRVVVQQPDRPSAPYAFLDDSTDIQMRDNDVDLRFTIGRIRAVGVEVRDDRLLALDERLAYTRDDAFPGGRRPTNGVALLFRRGANANEIMTISYALEPLGRVEFDPESDIAPFVPPDTFPRLDSTGVSPDQYGLLSQVPLEVEYDSTLDEYVVRADPDEEWAIQKGQILVIGARSNQRINPQTGARPADPRDGGAISPLEIRRTRRDTGGQLIGVLSATPFQDGFEPIIENLASSERVWAWAMRDVVRSESGGDQNVDWRVRPTGARIIRFGGN